MATPEKKLIQELYEVMGQKDPAKMRTFFADDFMYMDPSSQYGPDHYVSNFMETAGPEGAFPTMEFRVAEIVQEGKALVVEWMARAMFDKPVMGGIAPPPGGRPIMLGAFSHFTVEDGKIKSMRNSFGNQGLFEALGFIPPPPPSQ